MKNKEIKRIIAIVLGLKIATFLVIIFAHFLLPFNNRFYKANFVYTPQEKVTLFTSFKTWDAQHYLYLSEKGYRKNDISITFYPLYPLLISAATLVTGNSLVSGLLISNVLSLVAVIIFYRLVSILFDEKTAFFSTLFLLSFPTAFYLSLIYTEALFLFLTLLFFTFLYKKQYFQASVVSFLIPITRVVGLLIVIPMFVKMLTEATFKTINLKIPTFNRPIFINLKFQYAYLLFPIFGFLTYLLFMHFATGNALSGIKAGESFVGGYSAGNLLNPADIVKNFFISKLSLHNYNHSIIDRIFFVFFIILLPLIYKYLPKPFFFYSLIGLTPFLGSFMGYSRYVFVVFPIFIVLGLLVQKKWGLLLLPLLILFMFLQVTFIVLYSLNFWVS